MAETTLKAYGCIDILVNNAGALGADLNAPLLELPEDVLWMLARGDLTEGHAEGQRRKRPPAGSARGSALPRAGSAAACWIAW